jgi:hypothetical protein
MACTFSLTMKSNRIERESSGGVAGGEGALAMAILAICRSSGIPGMPRRAHLDG